MNAQRATIGSLLVGGFVIGGCEVLEAQTPPLLPRWSNAAQQFHIFMGMPIHCDQPTVEAARTWTVDAGSNWSLTFGSIRSERAVNGDGVITIDYDPNPPVQNAVAWVRRRENVWGTRTTDADVYFHEGYLFHEGRFHCGAGAPEFWQRDYESDMLHELGHVVGIADIRDAAYSAAIMWHQGAPWGATRRRLTTIDRNGAIHHYGHRQ
jgi:hypothetical protein